MARPGELCGACGGQGEIVTPVGRRYVRTDACPSCLGTGEEPVAYRRMRYVQRMFECLGMKAVSHHVR